MSCTSESSIDWALNKLKSRTPHSRSTSVDNRDDALLATLLRFSISGGRKNQSLKTGPLPAVTRRLTESCVAAAQRLSDVCAASGRVEDDGFNRQVDSWDAVHGEQTRAWAEDAFSSVRVAISNMKMSPVGASERQKKPIFNHEYTPLLEKYFEFNAYPSAPDRAILARKSMMTPRQIEVWFQNHRNRAKKEGKPLRRLTHQSLPRKLNLGSIEEKMSYFTLPEPAHQSSEQIKSENTTDELTENPHHPPCTPQNVPMDATLDPPRPLHAFPTVYSKRSQVQFLAEDKVFTFPPPVWRRKRSQCSSSARSPINMNALIFDFNQKLHLRAAARTSQNQSSQSWCADRTTIPCPAPLPALLQQSTMHTSLPSLRISTSASSTFAIPLTQSPLMTSYLTPLSTFTSPSPRRVVAYLPKSTSSTFSPRRPSTTLESSPIMSPSSSRSSSFSSDSSSSGSAVSSALTTPEKPTTVLPENDCPILDSGRSHQLDPFSFMSMLPPQPLHKALQEAFQTSGRLP
ncbi:hypothetical protein H0H93_014385 [Arthromyces matolae]|nr:hypothetical protein H0H93_014385 [Arthromyces matolae]